MTLQILWDAAKPLLRGKFIAIQAYLRKQEKVQINKLTLYLKQLKREEQTRRKVSRRKETIKIRAEKNEIEMKKPIEKINETKPHLLVGRPSKHSQAAKRAETIALSPPYK